jgi:hypothetical protein
MRIHDSPLFTDTYRTAYDFVPAADSAYILGESVEDRSAHVTHWKNNCSNVVFAHVIEQGPSSFTARRSSGTAEYPLRSERALSSFLSGLGRKRIYLDITTLEHRIWAPLLKVASQLDFEIIAVYVEPFDYTVSSGPTGEEFYDLSKSIGGIAPIPGFVCLLEAKEDGACLIPILGFEGARFAHIVEQVQPLGKGNTIVPIIGVPGFRPEYPFTAYLGNRKPLEHTQSWRRIRFATANCPFSLFFCLEDIRASHPKYMLQVAPIGTTPHALGAILFAIAHPEKVEVVYDHPTRRAEGTRGTARLLAYHLSPLMSAHKRCAP